MVSMRLVIVLFFILSLGACVSGQKTFYVPSGSSEHAQILFKTAEVGFSRIENQLTEFGCAKLQKKTVVRQYKAWGGKSIISNPENVVPMDQVLSIPAEKPIYFAQGVFLKDGNINGGVSCAIHGQFVPKKNTLYVIEYEASNKLLGQSTCKVKIFENNVEVLPKDLYDIQYKRC